MSSPRFGIIGPFFAALITFLFLAAGSFVAWLYVQDIVLLSTFNEMSDELLQRYGPPAALGAGLIFSFLVALLVYVSAGTSVRAQYVAEALTKKVSKNRAWYEQLYAYSPVAYVLLSKDTVVHEPNKAALRLFQTDETELEGLSFYELFPDDTDVRERVRDNLVRFERGITVPEQEIQVEQWSGALRWVLLSIHPIGTARGRTPETGIVTLMDITERKSVEEAKSEFVSLASHQLMTPLSAIKWYSGMLQSETQELTEKQQKYVEKIHQGNERMIDLINTLLNISRIELGTLAIEPKEIAVDREVESVIEEITASYEYASREMLREYDETVSPITTDPQLLRLIIQNLLSNAVKYTPETGTIRVIVSEEKGGVRIDVADTGYGIPPSQQDRIFDKMFRADNVRNEQKGTGLGLYMTKSIVELLGGNISFVSEQNVGTTFTVWLPKEIPQKAKKGKRLSSRGIS